MADEKNTHTPSAGEVPAQENSIVEKLKAAAGSIERHDADSKQRESELVRESKERAKEERLRTKEAEQRNADLHREAVLNAAAEREAFEEQRKLRKKLERERRRKIEEERRLLAEEKKAREEERAREVAEALERERAETEARKAKSNEILSRLNATEQPEVEQPETEEAEAEEPVEEETDGEEPAAVIEDVPAATEIPESVPTTEQPEAEEVEEPVAEEPEIEVEEVEEEAEVKFEIDTEELTEKPEAEEADAEEPKVKFEINTEELIEEPEAEDDEEELDEEIDEEVDEEDLGEEIDEEEPEVKFEIDTEELTKDPEEYKDEVTIADIDVMVDATDGKYLVHLKDGRYGYFVIGIDGEARIIPISQSDSPIVREIADAPAAKATTKKLIEKILPIVKSGKIKVNDIEPSLADPKEVRRPSSRIKLHSPGLADVEPFDEIHILPEPEVIERIPIGIYDLERRRPKILIEKPEDDEIPPLTFEDDLITSIKKQGKAVDDKRSYKEYIKRSEKAINSFYGDINRIDKNIDNLEDENDIPPMIVETINNMGKIVDIRSDNLAVTVRMKRQKDIEKYRDLLSSDIDNYNSRVAYFTKVTGSRLTRLSAFIPKAIIDGTGSPVIPRLSYTENYIEVFPDSDGKLPEDEDNILVTVIAPVVSFEEEIGNISPKNRDEAKDFVGRVNKAKKNLLGTINSTVKAIEKNARAKRLNLEKEEGAFTARDQDVTELYADYTRRERKSPKFARRLNAIDDRYRAVIIEARETRRERRYDDNDKSLHVERLTAERERVVFTLEAIRSLRGIVAPKELSNFAAAAVREMQTYNAMAKECGKRIDKDLTAVSGSLADDVMRTGEKYRFPLIVKRRELCERVGDVERIVGDRVRADYLKTTKAERLKRIKERFSFDGDKTLSDRALMREDVRVRAIERLAESVKDHRSFMMLVRKCKFAFKEFKRTLSQTDKAIFRARDRDGVISAVTENLRVRGKLIDAMSVLLECAAENNERRYIKKYMLQLEAQVERYNNRCADYRNITRSRQNKNRGYKLTQISPLLPENLSTAATTAIIPELSYRERYIECYPMEKAADNAYADPAKRGCDYNPIDYNDRRYTENDMVEITVINSPINAAESMRNDKKAKGRFDSRIASWAALFLIYGRFGLSYYLRRARRHKAYAIRQEKKFDKKLEKLIASYEKKTRKLNDKTPELLRDAPGYVTKMKRIELKYNKKSMKLRYKRVKLGIERRILNYSVRELAIYREVVVAHMLTLRRVRSSATKKSISGAKRNLVIAIREHNEIADALSLILGKPIARIATTVADEIVRESITYKLPKIALCKETVESVGNVRRSIGDPYRHGMPYTINSQGIAVVTGTCRIAPGVGIKGIGLDADLRPVIGATNTGLPYAGVPNANVLGIALKDNVATSATRAGSNSPIYGIATELQEPEDALFSDIDMKPVSEEIREINDYLIGAIITRAEAVSSVFDYRHYTRRTRPVRWKVERIFNATNKRFKKLDAELNGIFRKKYGEEDFEVDGQGNLTAAFRKQLAREGIGQLLEKKGKNVQTITVEELHSSIKYKKLIKRRANVFSRFADVRYQEQCRFVFELRTLAALGRLIEIRCADLVASSKIQLTIPMQIKLGLLGLGFNPRRSCERKLAREIERYNDVHVSRAEEIVGQENMYDLSLIDTMLPDGLANREALPDIPYLVYRDRFAEVVTTKLSPADARDADKEKDEIAYVTRDTDNSYGKKNTVIHGTYIMQTERSDDEGDDDIDGKEPEVNLVNSIVIPIMRQTQRDARFLDAEARYNVVINSLAEARKKGLPKIVTPGDTAISQKDFEKKIRDLISKQYDKLAAKLDRVIEEKLDFAEWYAAKNEKFVKKKLFALHRYEKAVFRISRITHETARYQRKMSRRLKMFRKRLYRLRMREIQFGIIGGRINTKADIHDMRVPSMSFEERRRRSAVEAMTLERKRLVLAVYLCKIVHGRSANDNEFRRKSALLSKARRKLTNAMIHYKNTTAECERILKTKKLWVPDMAWYKQVQNGDFEKAISDIPRLIALRQLAELYDEIRPIDQRAITTVIPKNA